MSAPLTQPKYVPDTREIALENVTKTYSDRHHEETVFREFSLDIERGSVVSVLGASGCGKTTLLNMISGIEPYDAGKIRPPEGRIGYMFQADRLLPWRTAERNALLGLELARRPVPEESRDRLRRYFEELGLRGAEGKYPSALSGGMRQRVALIRTLLCEPDVLLLDEPFAALDFEARYLLETEVLRFADEETRTMLFVTHDIAEAIAIGTRLLVLGGRPAAGIPARVVWNEVISFDSDIGGRDPVAVRKDPKFLDYYRLVSEVLKDAGARSR